MQNPESTGICYEITDLLILGDRVVFGGVIPFIIVVIAIIVTKILLSKIYAMLANEPISH